MNNQNSKMVPRSQMITALLLVGGLLSGCSEFETTDVTDLKRSESATAVPAGPIGSGGGLLPGGNETLLPGGGGLLVPGGGTTGGGGTPGAFAAGLTISYKTTAGTMVQNYVVPNANNIDVNADSTTPLTLVLNVSSAAADFTCKVYSNDVYGKDCETDINKTFTFDPSAVPGRWKFEMSSGGQTIIRQFTVNPSSAGGGTAGGGTAGGGTPATFAAGLKISYKDTSGTMIQNYELPGNSIMAVNADSSTTFNLAVSVTAPAADFTCKIYLNDALANDCKADINKTFGFDPATIAGRWRFEFSSGGQTIVRQFIVNPSLKAAIYVTYTNTSGVVQTASLYIRNTALLQIRALKGTPFTFRIDASGGNGAIGLQVTKTVGSERATASLPEWLNIGNQVNNDVSSVAGLWTFTVQQSGSEAIGFAFNLLALNAGE